MTGVDYGIPGVGDLERGTHLCALYSGPVERDDLLTPFLQAGLREGDKCLCLIDQVDPQEVRQRLVDANDPDQQPRAGQLDVDRARRATGTTPTIWRGRIIGALGGRAAEALVFGVTTTGAENDLEHATQIARQMVGRWGMSDQIGPVSVLPPEGDPRMAGVSDSLLDAVDQEVRRIIDECSPRAEQLLEENRSRLDDLAEQLLIHETLDQADAYAAAGIERVPQS